MFILYPLTQFQFYSHKILTDLRINLHVISGNPVQVDINMYVRSMGPISEMDMVSVKYRIQFIERVKRLYYKKIIHTHINREFDFILSINAFQFLNLLQFPLGQLSLQKVV